MTEGVSAEHYAAILGTAVWVVATFFMSKAGGSEGRRAAADQEQPIPLRQAVGALLADPQTVRSIVNDLDAINLSMTKLVTLTETLVSLTEGKEEKALREHLRDDFRTEMREMVELIRRQGIDNRSVVRIPGKPPEPAPE